MDAVRTMPGHWSLSPSAVEVLGWPGVAPVRSVPSPPRGSAPRGMPPTMARIVWVRFIST